MSFDEKFNKILAVDDNPKNIQLIGSILREANYQIGFAMNGRQALDLLFQSLNFDLVLLDVDMPVLNGFDVCREMREMEALKDIPVIFLTALDQPDQVLTGFEVGAQDYITKPFNSKELLSRVKTQLELKNNRDQLRKMNLSLEEKVNERTRELEQAYHKLEQANRELQMLEQSKDQFLQIISHEINTPLNGVMGYTRLLKEELQSTEFGEMLDYLETSAQRLEHFSRVSLFITQLRTKSSTIKMKPVSVNKLLADAISYKERQLLNNQCELTIEGNASEILIYGADGMIKICFESLLDNAIKYSPRGALIHILLTVQDDGIHISFTDAGTGFSPDSLRNLFKIFAPDKHVEHNKGLDLAMVKLIMDAHEGTINISNNAVKGATVELCFPHLVAESDGSIIV